MLSCKKLKNGKVYVGKAKKKRQSRWYDHLKVARGGPKKYKSFYYLHRAIAKHGEDNFHFKVLESFDDEKEALKAEQKWIKHYDSCNRLKGYNLTKGGEGLSGMKHSEKTKKAIKKSNYKSRDSMDNNTKLTKSQVIKIHQLLLEGVISQREIAQQFGISPQHVYSIKTGKVWKDIIDALPTKNEGRRRFSKKEISDIRRLKKETGLSDRAIGEKYGVGRETIRRIVNHLTYSS